MLGRPPQVAIGSEEERRPPGETEGLDDVLESGAEEAVFFPLHRQVFDQGHQGPEGPSLGAEVDGGALSCCAPGAAHAGVRRLAPRRKRSGLERLFIATSKVAPF
jgi:hypothetical protein